MLRDTGLHAALVLGLALLVGEITGFIAIGGAIGLLGAAVVTHRWPPRDRPVPGEVHDDGDPS